jgi:hypothetical protein
LAFTSAILLWSWKKVFHGGFYGYALIVATITPSLPGDKSLEVTANFVVF